MRKWLIGGVLSTAWACSPGPAPYVDEVHLDGAVENGLSYNGTSYGGLSLSYAQGQAWSSLGTPFEVPLFPVWGSSDFNPYGGLSPNGPDLHGVQLGDSPSVKVSGDVRVDDIIGATLEGELEGGDGVGLHVAGLATGTGANSDLLYYAVYVADGLDWSPLCGSDEKGYPIAALAVPGAWDQRQGHKDGGKWKLKKDELSFACRGSSVAKCMELGYKPWVDPESSPGNEEIRAKKYFKEESHLQACVRMLRADYCGDGTSFTVDGRRLEVWDSMGHHEEEMHWTFEAAWGPDGATCLSEPRVEFSRLTSDLDKGLPKCVKKELKKFEDRDECGQLKKTHKDAKKNAKEALKEGKWLYSAFETQLR